MINDSKSLYQKSNIQVVDLSRDDHRERIGRDLLNSRVIGEIRDWDFPSSNHQCEFDGIKFYNVRFNSKDFRDCVFKTVLFENCYFNESSIIGCTFINCEFVNTAIESYSIHDCIFVETNFINSSIAGSMIRYSRAQSCSFANCELDNKIFDECLLFDVKFISSNIDFGVLTDNFGLSNKLLPPNLIRKTRSYQLGNEEMMSFDEEELSKLEKTLSALESFRLQCYFSGDLMFSGPVIDNILSVNNWISSINTPSAFLRLISNLTEYAVREFDQNRSYLYFLLRLHYVMYRIYKDVAETYPAVAQAAIGSHHRLGSIISRYEYSVLVICRSHDHQLQFLTDGDFDIPEIQQVLEELQLRVGQFAYTLGPRNSPVLLEILDNYTLIIAIFLFTRLNFEIAQITTEKSNSNSPVTIGNKRLSITAGEGKLSLTTSAIGDVMVKASIELNSEILGKIRKILYKILFDSE